MTTYARAAGEALRDFYPAIEPFTTSTLKVDDTHEIYYECSGNPSGKPILFVHGGPGMYTLLIVRIRPSMPFTFFV